MPDLDPVQQSRRIQSIDVLRGAAALGILIMNVQLFAMIAPAFSNPYGCAWTDSANVFVWSAIQVVFGYKDLLIFGMLFGAGIAITDERGAAIGRSVAGMHYRRMAVMFVFGITHGYLVWSGDILYDYALCGCVVFLLRRQGILVQLVVGALAYALPLALLFVFDWVLHALDPDISAKIYSSMFAPTAEQITAHNALYNVGWLEQMGPRAAETLQIQVGLFPLGLFWVCSGSILAGMALYRWGMFSLRLATRSYLIMVTLGLFLGLPMILYGLRLNFAANWLPEYSILRGRFLFLLAAPITALGYVSLIMLVCRAGWFRWLTSRLAAVGQMALTSYIMQSLICSILFYGHGFGLVGKVDRVGQLGIVVAVWAVQLAVAPIWLRHFRFGPMEWLWRSLSYGSSQPMRRGASADSVRTPVHKKAEQPSRPMRTVWKLAALTAMMIPGLILAVTCQLLARKLAGPLVGRVVLYLIAPTVILIASYFCLQWFERRPLGAIGIGFDRPWVVQLFLGIVAGALMLMMCWVGLVVFADGNTAWPAIAPKLPGLRMTLGSMFILGLCFYEELLCRGYILQLMGRSHMKFAIAASGLLFVALHLSNPGAISPVAILNLVLLHFLMTALYLRTRSLWLPIGVHAGWNFSLGYVFGLPVSGVVFKGAILTTSWTPSLLAGNEFGPEGGLLVSFILLGATLAAWSLIRQRHPHPDLLA